MMNDLNYLLAEIEMISNIESLAQYQNDCELKRKEMNDDEGGGDKSNVQTNADLLLQFTSNS